MSGRLIVLDEHPRVFPFRVGEMWRRLFAKCVLIVAGIEATSACRDDELCARLKLVIGGAVHGVQAIWDTKSTTEDWGFLLVDAKTLSTISIVLVCFGKFVIYGRPEIALFFIVIVAGHHSFCITVMVRPVFCTVWRA